MPHGYEINDLAKEESWRLFRILGEFVEGFDSLSAVQPAITVYGSARLSSDEKLYADVEEIGYRLGMMGFSIITGGGPGVMEAANKGALRAGALSIGLNIELPQEQVLNPYTTKSITFHHFFIRKVMLVKYATAFVMMPGGLGTLDELTEVLTMIQTHKIKPFPTILYDSQYWKGFMDWLRGTTLQKKFISEGDLDLLRVCDKPEEVSNIIQSWFTKHEIAGKRAV